MPYIPNSRREAIDAYVDSLAGYLKETAKEGSWITDLEYAITRLTTRTLRLMFKEIRHWQIKVVLGIFQSISIEFYRRVASPYLNKQCELNGDVVEFSEYDMDLLPEELKDEMKEEGTAPTT
jgi:hypothetical protein